MAARWWSGCWPTSGRRRSDRSSIEASVAKGALAHTDEYDVYARLQDRGYGHKTVCHGRGEYARDEGGDGFCEVHVNTAEGFWSLLRSWLRPHRGISQEKLPAYLGFFQLVHNAPVAERHYLAPSSQAWLPRPMLATPKPDKSLCGYSLNGMPRSRVGTRRGRTKARCGTRDG